MTTLQTGPRDLWSFRTHFAGAFLALLATIYLIAVQSNWSFGVFGLSMIALYSCSSIFHYVSGPHRLTERLRKLDHAMIYVLIAGTYTPVLANCMDESKGKLYLLIIWAVALLGIIAKLCWMNTPRWFSTSLYLIMGWAIVFQLGSLAACGEFKGFMLTGGILYSVGAVIYMIKRPNIFRQFGFHELFHVFIILGSAAHFMAIAFYI